MHPRYVQIEEATLRELYVHRRLTLDEIAARLECGSTTVLRRLRRFGMPARSTAIHVKRKQGRGAAWVLRYAKREPILLLRWMYRAPDAPCVARKRAKPERFLSVTR